MESGVRYCTTDDGVRIAYTVEGDGPPLFLIHYVHAFSLSHLVPSFDKAIRDLGRGRSLIRYDMRGTGLSQRDIDGLPWAATQLDIEAVVRELEWEQVPVMGATVGGARAVDLAVSQPTKVSALILYEAFPRLLDAFTREMLQSLSALCRADWLLATRTLADTGIRRHDEQEGLRWAQYMRESLSGEIMAELIDAQIDFDVTPRLSQVACPTLVCHARHDPIWSFQSGLKLAEGIPGARLIPLEGHEGGPFTNYHSMLDAIEPFLADVSKTAAAPVSDTGPAVPLKPLTPRETEVLRLIAAGRTSKEISDELSLSVRTVGRHITNIYDKIGARGRADATAYALRNGLTDK